MLMYAAHNHFADNIQNIYLRKPSNYMLYLDNEKIYTQIWYTNYPFIRTQKIKLVTEIFGIQYIHKVTHKFILVKQTRYVLIYCSFM